MSAVTKMRIRQIQEIEVSGLGNRIKQARLASDKSLEQLCAEVDLSRTYWYDIERETLKGTLSVENLRKIETALETDFGVEFYETFEERDNLPFISEMKKDLLEAKLKIEEDISRIKKEPFSETRLPSYYKLRDYTDIIISTLNKMNKTEKIGLIRLDQSNVDTASNLIKTRKVNKAQK